MKIVIYSSWLEPITVVDLTPQAMRFLRETGTVRLPVYPVLEPGYVETSAIQDMRMYIVTLKAEVIRRGAHEGLMVFADDDATALRLKAAFLPGQYSEVQKEQHKQFARGVQHALDNL